MKTVAEILKHDSYSFLNSKYLYRKGDVKPYLQYLRRNTHGKHEYSPSHLPFRPQELYMHPYLPHLDVRSIRCLYDGIFYKMGQIIPASLIQGERWFIVKKKRFALTEADVYNNPEYFQPIYKEIASDYRGV